MPISPPYRVLERHPGDGYNGQSHWAHPEGLYLKPGEAIVVIDEAALALIDVDVMKREKVRQEFLAQGRKQNVDDADRDFIKAAQEATGQC
jgi:hypothetical protein